MIGVERVARAWVQASLPVTAQPWARPSAWCTEVEAAQKPWKDWRRKARLGRATVSLPPRENSLSSSAPLWANPFLQSLRHWNDRMALISIGIYATHGDQKQA